MQATGGESCVPAILGLHHALNRKTGRQINSLPDRHWQRNQRSGKILAACDS